MRRVGVYETPIRFFCRFIEVVILANKLFKLGLDSQELLSREVIFNQRHTRLCEMLQEA